MTLQFGHGGEAVETSWNLSRPRTHSALQFGHGGEAVETFAKRQVGGEEDEKLQFGHGGEAVETVLIVSFERFGIELQFGHGGEAVETKDDRSAPVAHRAASIRPRR